MRRKNSVDKTNPLDMDYNDDDDREELEALRELNLPVGNDEPKLPFMGLQASSFR